MLSVKSIQKHKEEYDQLLPKHARVRHQMNSFFRIFSKRNPKQSQRLNEITCFNFISVSEWRLCE